MNLVLIIAFVVSIFQGYQIYFFEIFVALITIVSLIGNKFYIRKSI